MRVPVSEPTDVPGAIPARQALPSHADLLQDRVCPGRRINTLCYLLAHGQGLRRHGVILLF